MTKESFFRDHPSAFFLDPANPKALGEYLSSLNRLTTDEYVVSADKAGEGNMNCVVRVTTNQHRFILKQSRPWVEKYPQIAAPWDRALAEGRFYAAIAENAGVASMMPRVRWTDDDARLLALEDLGESADFFPLYRGEIDLSDETLCALLGYLSALHAIPLAPAVRAGLANRAMRELNHAHIFDLPLRADNGFPLESFTPGLEAVATSLQQDRAYVAAVHELGRRYLADGPALLHGDFFPGSFLRVSTGLKVIDPEFGFAGEAEFDVGVLVAHLHLATQPASIVNRAWSLYRPIGAFSIALARQFAGVEIMRRLIGIAQLPLAAGLDEKRRLLDLSRRLVLHPDEKS